MSMTRIQRRRMFRVIQGGKRDDATAFDLAFAPVWFWMSIMGVWK